MLQEMLVRGTRLTILLSIPFCVILGCFARPIVGIWLELPKFEPTIWALIILSLADVATHVRETQGFVMTGLNRVRFITMTQVIGGFTTMILGVGVTALLVHLDWGFNAIIGVAIPAAVVGWLQAAVISVYVARATGVGGRRYFKESFLWPLVCLVISTVGALIISTTLQPQTLVGLMACAALAGTLCAIVGWTIGFDQIDRQRVLQMFNRLIGLVRRRSV
jgi:O-antigen/teichoic acid export membrane protein